MSVLRLPRGDWRLVVTGALLLVLAYPPFHLFLPSFLCLIPAVLLLVAGAADPRPVRRHLAQGFWFGLAANGLVLYWMVVALWHFTPLSALGYAASILVLALWTAVLFALTGWIHRSTGLPLWVVFPVGWTAVEWAIGHQGDIRFPWLGLGTSLTGYPVMVQIADIVGARGVTLLLAAANAALAFAWLARSQRRQAVRFVASVGLGVALSAGYGVVRMRTLPIRALGTVAAIQPAHDAEQRWNSSQLDSIAADLLDLSHRALVETRPNLVLWPEAAVPHVLGWHPDWVIAIGGQARTSGAPIVVGGIDYRGYQDRSYEYWNAAFVFDTSGRYDTQPVYHKNYLVPIVERVPFVNPRWFDQLRWFGGQGRGEPGAVYQAPMGRFGILICYESAFENLARRYRRQGAEFLVNITNDAWFGRTAAPYQHAAHLVMRAIETRIGIARAANTGISEFVDPLGREHGRTRLGERTVVAGEVFTADVTTLYTRLGDWVGTLCVVGSLVLCGGAWWRSRSTRRLGVSATAS